MIFIVKIPGREIQRPQVPSSREAPALLELESKEMSGMWAS